MSTFLSYVNHPDIHDGTLLHIQMAGDTIRVIIRAYGGHQFAVEFSGATVLRAVEPEGMVLYALSEWSSDQPDLRRFSFASWHEADESRAELEIAARDLSISGFLE